MPLHMLKLCVGAESVEDLEAWQDKRVKERRKAGEAPLAHHDTRMFPKRREEILAGGSLYWVIKGVILTRQRIVGLEERADAEGRGFCRILLEPKLVRTEPRGKRAFQGWRYFDDQDAPPDLNFKAGSAPPELAAALKDALAW